MIHLLDKRPLGRDAEPEVPVQTFGNRRAALGPIDAVRRPDRPIRPGVGLFHFADRAAPESASRACDRRRRCALGCPSACTVPALRRRERELPRFVNRARQRLLGVGRYAHLHGRHGDRRVHVIGRRDGDAVQPLCLLCRAFRASRCSVWRRAIFRRPAPKAAVAAFLSVSAGARVSTSQNATTLAAPFFEVSVISPQPLPPTPTAAMFGLSLGAAFSRPEGRDRDRRHCGGSAEKGGGVSWQARSGWERREGNSALLSQCRGQRLVPTAVCWSAAPDTCGRLAIRLP